MLKIYSKKIIKEIFNELQKVYYHNPFRRKQADKIMIAFEAATPFQVFNCINIYESFDTDESADIFLYTYATDMTNIANGLKDSGIFANVYILKNTPQPGRKQMISFLLRPYQLMAGVPIKEYIRLYISYSGIPNMVLYSILQKKNPKIKLYFYEDGVSSYYNGLFKHAKSVEIIRTLRGLKNDSQHVEEIILYEPRLNKVEYKAKRIRKLKVTENPEIIKSLETIFGVTDHGREALNWTQFIYFDHDFKKYISKDCFMNFDQNEIVHALSLICGSILVKVSPLQDIKNAGYFGENIIVSNFEKAPWEILIAGDISIEKRCLIAVCSNAVVTPKTVYGREPFVLLLGKALYNAGMTNSTDVWTENMGNYFKEIKELYKQKEKFCVAESMDEALDFIKRVHELT